MPEDAVICTAETSIFTKSNITTLNIPFIHVNYGKGPHGSHNMAAKPLWITGIYLKLSVSEQNTANQNKPDSAWNLTFRRTLTEVIWACQLCSWSFFLLITCITSPMLCSMDHSLYLLILTWVENLTKILKSLYNQGWLKKCGARDRSRNFWRTCISSWKKW